VRDAFAAIHELRKQKDPDSQKLIDTLTFVCSKLKDVFDLKTKYSCSICIKVVKETSKVGVESHIITLCRDAKTGNQKIRTSVDKHNDAQNVVFLNTRFLNFFQNVGQNKGKYYLNNNIPVDTSYVSHTKEHHGGKLPYNSEIVVPICPLNHAPHGEEPLLYGFLCVDSIGIDIFNDTYDVGLIQGVADGIFDIINVYLSKRTTVALA